ncbi:MAG: hypothetical protein BWY63_03509 [Chloroflexi bacterium ADurb.Bin360]|nr:MAG: hypothetical protein BWY63_03509 [Chloroflexi bacterium ADurb.Bin360]
MGQAFSKCRTKEQMHNLSEGLSRAFRQALAVPTRMIRDKNPLRKRPHFIPVLPLILGGDDLLALVPAPWALDFAMQFCNAYEEAMGDLFKEINLQEVPVPTVSVAVVICKSKHPFKLAYEAGESRLKDAKRVSKRLGLSGGSRHSSISFEVVLGGRLVGASPSGRVRPTLRPYWVHDNIAGGWGFSVRKLVEQRYELRNVPNKRLIELRDLYDDLPASLKTEDLSPWEARLNQLLVRIAREKTNRTAIDSALEDLGSKPTGWYRVDRAPDDLWYGHGLPDLIEAWDFALDLGKERQEYEEGAQ